MWKIVGLVYPDITDGKVSDSIFSRIVDRCCIFHSWTSVSTLARIINRERIIIEGKVGRSKTRRDIFLHVGELGTSEVAESFLRFYPGRKGAVDRKYISRKKLFMTACGTGLLLSSRF